MESGPNQESACKLLCLCRYGPREDYRRYVATTPVLLPFMKPFYINNEAKPFESEAANLAPKPSS